MCVIVTGTTEKPTLDDLRSMEAANGDGNGIAYSQDGKVHYEKGISLERLHKLLQDAPAHWCAHFRISTAGGTPDELTHPFPIDQNAPIDLAGTAREVLFHNGHVSDWEELTLKAMARKRSIMVVPKGPWSDSRAVAWVISHMGRGMLNFVKSGKFLLLSASGIRMYPTDRSGWTNRAGYWVSNMNWVGRRAAGYPHRNGVTSESIDDFTWDKDTRSWIPKNCREQQGVICD